MKKLVFILLLVLMPLQASWGVVSAYMPQEHDACLHTACPAASHNQAPQAQASDTDPADTAGVHHEDRFCSLHALTIIDAFPQLHIPLPLSVSLEAREASHAPQSVFDRPERPKWPAA